MAARRRWLLGGIAVAAVAGGVAAGFLLLGGDGEVTPESGAPATPEDGAAPGAEDVVETLGAGRDGDFLFEVLDVSCGFENVVTPDAELSADGEFCLVAFRLTNEADRAQGLELSCQYLFDSGGQRHTPRDDATLMDSEEIFGGEIPPGFTYEQGGAIFDVPVGTMPASVELHGSCDTEGLRITL